MEEPITLPSRWRQHVRLGADGKEALIVSTPERSWGYDAGDGGAVIGAGQAIELALPTCAHGVLSYKLYCEDGLDIRVLLRLWKADGSMTEPVEPERRATELEGALRLPALAMDGCPAARAALCLDNTYSWFNSKTVHLRAELSLEPAGRTVRHAGPARGRRATRPRANAARTNADVAAAEEAEEEAAAAAEEAEEEAEEAALRGKWWAQVEAEEARLRR